MKTIRVFDREVFLGEPSGFNRSTYEKMTWPYKCDGKEVEYTKSGSMNIDGYTILKGWTKEITVFEPGDVVSLVNHQYSSYMPETGTVIDYHNGVYTVSVYYEGVITEFRFYPHSLKLYAPKPETFKVGQLVQLMDHGYSGLADYGVVTYVHESGSYRVDCFFKRKSGETVIQNLFFHEGNLIALERSPH